MVFSNAFMLERTGVKEPFMTWSVWLPQTKELAQTKPKAEYSGQVLRFEPTTHGSEWIVPILTQQVTLF